MLPTIRNWLTRLGVWTAHPAAFAVVVLYGVLWIVFDWHDFGWHEGAVLATFMMTLVIQRAEHRDTQALHAKLDELLRAHGEAQTDLAGLDDEEPEVIERHRAEARGGL
jgi:low affinity Fe/Cu permease